LTNDLTAYKKHMENYHYFLIEGYEKPFGYIHNSIVEQMIWPDYWNIDRAKRFVTLTSASHFVERTNLVKETLRRAHESKQVPVLQKLSNELVPTYSATGEHVLDINGCGEDVFGIINFSVHMIAWVMTKDGPQYLVPRRSMTISFPGMLDSSVGGTLASGERPIDCIVRECQEEISLDPAYTRANIKPCGTISYHMCITDRNEPGSQLQVQYLYELVLGQDIVPKIGDGEVGEIHYKTLDQVKESMRRGEFKLNCNMTWLAFMIRHGHLNAENEPDLVEICSRIHRKHDLFVV
jgi:8-oxo-dGTP pyrophosphatase MutT (NUDIX family)